MEIIQLPELESSSIYNQCVLSNARSKGGCHILFKAANLSELAFCQIGDDEFMKMSKEDNKDMPWVQTLKFFHGDIYALVGIELRLVTISFVGKTVKFRSILKSSGDPWCISPLCQPWSTDQKYYLMDGDDDDEMLLACKMSPATYLHQFCDLFKTYRINIKELELVELVDIAI
ncbi:hypothetical protein ACS0TY_014036 [Phlomoides rotata]